MAQLLKALVDSPVSGFCSQHPHRGSQLSVAPVPSDLHTVHIHEGKALIYIK